MAGIKHGMWGQFPTGKSEFISEEDWQKNMILNHQVNCKLCGNNIHAVSKDEYGKSTNWEWEMQNGAHQQCYMDYMNKLRDEQRGSEPR